MEQRCNPLTPDVEATLVKLRKHVTTGLTPKKLAAAYAVMGVAEKVGVTAQPMKELDLTFWTWNDDSAAIQRWMKSVEVTRQAPAKPAEGRIYAVKAPTLRQRESTMSPTGSAPEASVPAGSTVGTPTKVRDVPGVGPLMFFQPIRWNRDGTFKASGYWIAADPTTHQAQEDQVADLASRALGMPTVAEEKRQKKATASAAKVAKGGGICGVCFEAHKVYDHGSTYPHGYKMNTKYGRGHQGSFKQPGQCAGAQSPSWERGPQTTLRHAADLRRSAQRHRDLLTEIKAGGHPDIHIVRTPARWGRKSSWRLSSIYDLPEREETRDVLHPGDPEYAEADKQRRVDHKQQAEGLDKSAAWFEHAAAGWPALPQ